MRRFLIGFGLPLVARAAVVVPLAMWACDKSGGSATPDRPGPSATAAPSATTASAPHAATTVEAPAPTATAAPSTSVALTATPTATATAAPNARDAAAPPAASSAAAPTTAAPTETAPPPAPAAPPKPSYARAGGNHFVVNLSNAGDCKPGGDCRVMLRLDATDGYHVNSGYPHKLVANAANATFKGTGDGGRTFSKATGSVALQEKVATITVTFVPSASGPLAISGTLKTCVCTESVCVPEDVNVAINVNVQ